MIIGSAFAAPERLRRDAPILPEWQVPDAGFEGRAYEGGYNVGFGSFRDDELIHEEYGPPPIPHEDYGPPAVPHEDYGPPRLLPVPETTPQ